MSNAIDKRSTSVEWVPTWIETLVRPLTTAPCDVCPIPAMASRDANEPSASSGWRTDADARGAGGGDREEMPIPPVIGPWLRVFLVVGLPTFLLFGMLGVYLGLIPSPLLGKVERVPYLEQKLDDHIKAEQAARRRANSILLQICLNGAKSELAIMNCDPRRDPSGGE